MTLSINQATSFHLQSDSADSAAQIAELNGVIEALTAQTAEAHELNVELSGLNEALAAQLATAESATAVEATKLTEANAKVDELKRKLLDAMGSPLKDLADEAANLEVVIVQADLDSLRLSHGSAVEEAACLEADLAEVRAELTSELAEAHAATEALQGELQTASARVESLEQDLKGRESVTELEQKLQNGQAQMDTFKQLVEGKLKDGQVQLAGANARIMQYMGELAVLRKDANNSAEVDSST